MHAQRQTIAGARLRRKNINGIMVSREERAFKSIYAQGGTEWNIRVRYVYVAKPGWVDGLMV